MTRFAHIGERLRTRRLGVHLSTDQVAQAAGISRALLYRYESGDIVKLEVLERLAALYETSTSALLGLGNDYITHGLPFFDRIQRLEEQATQLTIVFGPLAYMLSSPAYDEALSAALVESEHGHTPLSAAECRRLMHSLQRRKSAFAQRRPALVNIIPTGDIVRYLRDGLGGRHGQPSADLHLRRKAARREMESLARLIDTPPMGVQIVLTTQPLPTAGFELVQLPDRRVVVTSPFRIGEPTNMHYGVAMVSEDPQALRLYDTLVARLWDGALKGAAAMDELRRMVREAGA